MEFKITPWAHQLKAITKAISLPWFAFFFEMGTGKTLAAVVTLRIRNNQAGRILRTIIFGPPLTIPQWQQAWYDNTDIDKKKVVPLYGHNKDRLKLFLKNAYEPDGKKRGCVFITNYESLLMPDLLDAFHKWTVEALVWDESQKLKSTKAKRSKLAHELSNPRDRVTKKLLPKPLTYILTGTPILKSPMDLYMQFKIMDGGKSFSDNFFRFQAKYFRDRNCGIPKDRYFPKWEIMNKEKDGVDALEQINKIIYECGMRVEKKDCLDLPPEVTIKIDCPMSPTQERLYNEMKKDFITFYNSKACTASLAITKSLRLMQISSGYVSVQDPEGGEGKIETTFGDTPKYEKLKELLELILENGGKVLVWAVFQYNYEAIRRAWSEVNAKLKTKYKLVEIHGKSGTEKQKREAITQFQIDENTRGLLGHPDSGGVGLNLTQAGYSIRYSRNFSLEQYLQSRARNHRGGAKEAGHSSITHYELICPGIEELVLKSLAQTLEISDKVLRQIVEELQQGDTNGNY